MHTDRADVVVIGAGVSGLSSAYYLAKGGKDVVVVEKGVVGGEASGRSGGLISAGMDEGPVMPTIVESLKLWPTLHEELGYPTEFTYEGRLKVALSEEDLEQVYQVRDNYLKYDLDARMVDFREIQDMVPGIAGDVVGGMFSSNGGHANPQRTVQAFAWGFRNRGGRLYEQTAVTGITVKDGRVALVETTSGSIETDYVVCAAGPQASLIGELVGVRIPAAPIRAESIVTFPIEPRFGVALVGNGLYLRQSVRGNILGGGGPMEWIDVGLTSAPPKPNTPLVRNLARRLAELLPGIEDLRLLRSWAGIVEVTPDGEPIIDMLDNPRGFIVVCQSAHGFAPSPATGVAVSELVIKGKSSLDLHRYRLSRFDTVPENWRELRQWQRGAYNT